MFHWRRFHNQPLLYSSGSRVFPPKLGRPLRLSEDQSKCLALLIKQRISNNQLQFPTLYTFSRIAEDITGHSFSLSTMSRFCKQHKFVYDCPSNKKKGTRYHDSSIVIQERREFLIKKAWYLAWEQAGLVEFFVHDESHIAEKPSGYQYWQFVPESGKGAIDPGKKIGGRRFAFSSLYSRNYGLDCGASIDELSLLSKSIKDFKNVLDDLDDLTVTEYLKNGAECGILTNQSMSIDSKNRMFVPQDGNRSFFQFLCATPAQNKGISKQMDSAKFIWSLNHMVRQAIKCCKNKTVVIQLDNATYHREPADPTLRKIINPYPVRARDGINRSSMVEELEKWGILPMGETVEWYKPLSADRRKKTMTKSELALVEQQRKAVKAHKLKIKELYHLAPQYRHQKTRAEGELEELSAKSPCDIIVLFGPRGHSELAEIEFSWSFIKRKTIDLNPQTAKDTRSLLEFNRRLDFSNRQSWRDLVLVNMYSYIHYGYYDTVLGKKLLKKKTSILEYWDSLFAYTIENFSFTPTGFEQFFQYFDRKIVKQLTYPEILSLD